MSDIIIKRNYNMYFRMLAVSIVSLFFVLRTIISFYTSGNEGNVGFLVISYIFGVFLVILFFNSVRQLLNRNPALIISESGIEDNISLLRPGMVSWSKIKDAEVTRYKGTMQLVIKLHDNDEVLENLSTYKSKILHVFIRDLETPWVINVALIKTDISELHRLILERSSRKIQEGVE